MVSRILDSVKMQLQVNRRLTALLQNLARVYTPVVVALAVATAIIPSIFTGDWNHWVYTAITFPCHQLSVRPCVNRAAGFFSGIGSGSKKGILFKGGVAIEALRI